MPELAIEIAGVGTRIDTPDPALATLVGDRYKSFLASGSAAWHLDASVGATPDPLLGGDVRVRRRDGDGCWSVERGDFVGAIDLRRRHAAVTVSEANEFSIDSFLRIAYSLALLEVGGLIVHAASLVRAERAYLFPGRSGSGKSTISRLSPEATLLTDELSIVRLDRGRARCYGTPFWGEVARGGEDRAAPLHAIYFLQQASRHGADAVTPRQALTRLLPNVVFFAREPALTSRVLDLAAALVEAVPCFDLQFRRDRGFWEVIDRG